MPGEGDTRAGGRVSSAITESGSNAEPSESRQQLVDGPSFVSVNGPKRGDRETSAFLASCFVLKNKQQDVFCDIPPVVFTIHTYLRPFPSGETLFRKFFRPSKISRLHVRAVLATQALLFLDHSPRSPHELHYPEIFIAPYCLFAVNR